MAVTHSRTLPSNVEAEESLLGAMLLDPDARSRGIDLVGPEDFYLPTHAEIFEAIRVLHHSGSGVDAVTVRDEWLRLSAHPTSVDSPKLISLQTNTPSTANAAYYARAVLQAADARRMLVAVTGAAKTLSQRGDPYEVAEQLIAELAAIDSPVDRSRQEAVTIDAVLERVETLSPWVVSGLLRSDHRATLVAPVKQGKSVLLRQMAMLSAQGLHPLMPSRRIPPVRSLIFDLENPQAAVAETGGRMVTQLRHTLGAQYNPERCKIVNWPQGVDLRSRQVRARFEREIAIHAPDLVCIGPAYKMFDRRSGRHGVESYEEATEGLLRVLDDLRTRYKFALMIETHSGHGDTERAYGSHRWLEWPELCMVMSRKRDDPYKWVLKIEARLSHDWPLELHRGADWPWVGDWGDNRATVPNQPNRANQARLGDEEEF